MATTTATLTLSSADLSSQALSITATSTLYKAGTTIGLDQTTGLTKKIYAAAQSNIEIIKHSNDEIHISYFGNIGKTQNLEFFIEKISHLFLAKFQSFMRRIWHLN